ncbi:conserved hypothetical protein [Ricinus communis]|uniref:Uncharacterized protein n=1 Tax=Ricinus communis TaxID=3988 RepID=B9RSK0_RICCO|nr:conserved hypothetical protein [Ricinus communis]
MKKQKKGCNCFEWHDERFPKQTAKMECIGLRMELEAANAAKDMHKAPVLKH